MEDWPTDKKRRVYELIKEIHLPDKGTALDFGCGNGVFTDLIKEALPNWDVYGCDISENAINNAKERFKNCSFFVSDNSKIFNMNFDLLLSHHVLEHVFDLNTTIEEIDKYLNKISYVFHILPCGNINSFEHNICQQRIGGINTNMENRFFYEDEGHVRRLTTENLINLMNKYGFTLIKEYYSNQFIGAIKWISRENRKFILNITDYKKAINKKSYYKLLFIRIAILMLYILQLPAVKYDTFIKNKLSFKKYIKLIVFSIPIIFSYPFYKIIDYLSEREWKKNNQSKNGSEMFLIFQRK